MGRGNDVVALLKAATDERNLAALVETAPCITILVSYFDSGSTLQMCSCRNF